MNRTVAAAVTSLVASSAFLLTGESEGLAGPVTERPEGAPPCPSAELVLTLTPGANARQSRSWSESCGIEAELVPPPQGGSTARCTVQISVRHNPSLGRGATVAEDRYVGDCTGYSLKTRIKGQAPFVHSTPGDIATQATSSHRLHIWIDGMDCCMIEMFGIDTWTDWQYDGTKINSADSWWLVPPSHDRWWYVTSQYGDEYFWDFGDGTPNDAYFSYQIAEFYSDGFPFPQNDDTAAYVEVRDEVYKDGTYWCDYENRYTLNQYTGTGFRRGCGLDW